MLCFVFPDKMLLYRHNVNHLHSLTEEAEMYNRPHASSSLTRPAPPPHGVHKPGTIVSLCLDKKLNKIKDISMYRGHSSVWTNVTRFVQNPKAVSLFSLAKQNVHIMWRKPQHSECEMSLEFSLSVFIYI